MNSAIRNWVNEIQALTMPSAVVYCDGSKAERDRLIAECLATGELIEQPQPTYADLTASTSNNATHEWAHPVSDVLGALLERGLRLELFNEHDYTLFPRWPHLIPAAGGLYLQPEGAPRLPLIYSLRARRD